MLGAHNSTSCGAAVIVKPNARPCERWVKRGQRYISLEILRSARSRDRCSSRTSDICFLPTAFCLLPTAFRLLPSAYCLLRPYLRNLWLILFVECFSVSSVVNSSRTPNPKTNPLALAPAHAGCFHQMFLLSRALSCHNLLLLRYLLRRVCDSGLTRPLPVGLNLRPRQFHPHLDP